MASPTKVATMTDDMTMREVKGRSPWVDARRRFVRNKASLGGLIALILIAIIALFGDSIAVWSNEDTDWEILGSIYELGGPSIGNGHYFGVDENARDLYSRTLQGTRISLMVGIVGSVVAVVVGTLYGATSGYVGGRTDQAMMRLVDILLSVPFMFVVILLLVMFGRSLVMLFLGIGLISWLNMARIVRGQTLSLKHKEFVDRYVAQNRKLPARFAIKRFVPVSGSHTISALLQSELDHFRDPHWHSSRSSVLAAINGGFFLNFPEEYQHPWCAMNDPVGMMILGGCIRQLPLVARGAVLVSEDGQATIQAVSMADIALRLPWETSWRSHASSQAFAIDDPRSAGRQVTVFTPAFGALQPAGQQKTPLGDCVDFVVVFGELMESRIGGGCHIPANGIVISCPLADFPGEDVLALLQRHGRQIEFRFLHEKFTAQKIVTAVAAGPLLLQNGKFIAIDFFEQKPPPEQFVPARFDNGLSAQAGVAPTRFPHDADRTRAPRTILGVTPENRLLLAVIDGRARSHSLGATLPDWPVLSDARRRSIWMVADRAC